MRIERRLLMPVLALAVAVLAVGPGFLLSTWAVLLIPTATAEMTNDAVLGLGMLIGAVLLAVALPVAAIVLGARTRHQSALGRWAWFLGWAALALAVTSAVLLYSIAPSYFRYE